MCASLRWDLYGADAKSAFMQGGPAPERKEPIFMDQPRDGILGDSLPGLVPGQLLEVLGAVYGFINSPHLWFKAFTKKLLELGWLAHSLDAAVFMKYQAQVLVALLIIHVDDILLASDPKKSKQAVDELKNAFEWGRWRKDKFIFNGRDLERLACGDVTMSQSSYCRALDRPQTVKAKAEELDRRLTSSEMTEFRSCTGTAQWVSGQTRPECAAATSLVQDAHPTLRNLAAAQQLVHYVADNPDQALRFRSIPHHRLVMLAYGDSSWANAPGHKSQAGFLNFLADRDALQPSGGQASLLDWKTHRIRRACRSTIGAEAGAADVAIDHAVYAATAMHEIWCQGFRSTQCREKLPKEAISVYLITDCRSLYDCLVKLSPPNVEEKRVAIDICSIREQIDASHVKWTPTQEQWADFLTKIQDPSRFIEMLNLGRLRLSVVARE